MKKSVALVTGGSSGLGFEIARCLVERGIDTWIVGRSGEKLANAVALLRKSANSAEIASFIANIGEEQQVKALFNHLESKGLVVDKIFNVAGIGLFGDASNITEGMIDKVFEANLIGLILVTSYGLRSMKDNGGTIYNVLSTAALVGREKESVYCAAKWGARGFTEAVRAATKGTKISIVSIYPGGMNTPFWSENCGLSPDVSKFMKPSDVAARIIDLMSRQDTSIVTEATINRRS